MPSYRARWILPITSPPIPNGLLSVENGRIESVGTGSTRADTIDLGNVVLMPGLVNAHSHLEYSELTAPIGKPGIPLVDWISLVVAWKRQRDQDPIAGLHHCHRAIEAGLVECALQGVTDVGEITTLPSTDAPYASTTTVSTVLFLEILGLSEAYLPAQMEAVRRFTKNRTVATASVRSPVPSGLVRGISPHAPYTVGLELLARICKHSARQRYPVAMHLAESEAEIRLLATGDGPFVELLASLGAWVPSAFRTRRGPEAYIQQLVRAHRALIIHGNYLRNREIRKVAEHRDRCSIVFCPRTHHFFRHARYPLVEMLAAGVNVAVGTDSKASNPDLNLLAELRWIAAHYPELDWEQVIRLGTFAGAVALGIEDRVGSLAPGKCADLIALQLPDRPGIGPEILLEDPTCKVVNF